MARMRVFLILALALTVGSVFSYATYNYVKTPARTGNAVATKPVVVAATDLEIGTEVGTNDVHVVQWPADSVPTNAFGTAEEVIGRGLISPMVQNEPFLPTKLASKELGAGLPPAIPPGLRAVSVKVNEVIGVAGYVLPGTRVDVVATVSTNMMQSTDMISKVILTNVPVLAAGTKIDTESDKNKPIAVTVVTLLVDPEQAERLTLASTEGKIQLALRNPLDKDTPSTRGIKAAMLVGTPASTPKPAVQKVAAAGHAAPPAPAAPEPLTVEIIRGDKRAQEVIREER
jgi:pilus assembly protein CpaB